MMTMTMMLTMVIVLLLLLLMMMMMLMLMLSLRRYLFDFVFSVEWEVELDCGPAKGTLKYLDVTPDCDGDYDTQVEVSTLLQSWRGAKGEAAPDDVVQHRTTQAGGALT
jgi:hypothetical protein